MTNGPSIESIKRTVLELQPDARVQLTHSLVQSLDNLPESEVAELWLAEAEGRDAEMESGQAAGISNEEVFDRIQVRHGK